MKLSICVDVDEEILKKYYGVDKITPELKRDIIESLENIIESYFL